MSLSPDASLLAALHMSGALSIWEVPSLRLRYMWPLEEQVEIISDIVYVGIGNGRISFVGWLLRSLLL